jgi:hypothetical protein
LEAGTTATLNIKDDTYEKLARKAVAQNTTVEDFIEPLLDRLAETEPAAVVHPPLATAAQRERAFAEWMAQVQERASRYPAGFVVDDSRESIYEGRGE